MLLFCREDVTRTRDPYVPNVVRYQLRHFSDTFHFSKAGAKVLLFFYICKLFCTFFAKSAFSWLNWLIFCHNFANIGFRKGI